ncbi:hypothetical protein [Solwaraspora sp. WMMD792]|uniref:hypothetical protein n=1 Tax=Solwaraspora sp. WMMD792 TaxID=3016099 RepID=UPI0024173835|nr:hypothetical protein [Solwaraspora sp. WMMD792]MDG4773993.1 hypothetical protein [Solwaraspora sp. WMMD792]
MEQEYWAETEALELPAGVTWPPVIHQEPAPDHEGVLRGHSYEPGFGRGQAQGVWFCIWQKEWLTQRSGAPERADAALVQLNAYKGMVNYQEYSDAMVRAAVDEQLEKAALGDPSLMAKNVEINCPEN